MKYRTVLLFGAPGAGKGTQGKIIGNIPGFFHCASGDLFRNLPVDSSMGRLFLEYSSHGKLVPDEPTIELWRQFIEDITRQGRFHPERDVLVLDGIPRNLRQAEMLRAVLDVRAVIYLHCADFKKMVHRMQTRALKENRLDDANLAVIRNRLKVYEKETKPVLNFYGRKLVHDVDSILSPVKVLARVLRVLDKI
ncbi:MAG TPA: nucleoside monophosphate kinase [Dongiaceae bacterium]|jgi:adenylate kinase|nr:nucleoside monophosphate kinase [Dongiaceae bacterium]